MTSVPRSIGSWRPTADDVTAGDIAELRAQGLSVRAISERTGIPRSTVADRLAELPDAPPERVTGRDGRHYRAARRSSGESEASVTPTADRRGSRLDGGLARALLLDQLRMARWLSADADPLRDEDRARIARDLRAIARRTGVRLSGGSAILNEGLHRRDRRIPDTCGSAGNGETRPRAHATSGVIAVRRRENMGTPGRRGISDR